ncbi:unnamed protein product, partial [Trichogramma brassicae]
MEKITRERPRERPESSGDRVERSGTRRRCTGASSSLYVKNPVTQQRQRNSPINI